VDRLLYVAMTGAKQLMQAQALVSHNLANVSTTGFRADLARFEARPVVGPGYASRVNTVATGLGFDRSQGALMQTGEVLDVAVDGDGWIAVQARDGNEAFVRSASLKVNAVGLLETESGELVLGDNGPLAIPPYTQLSLASDGTVSIVPQGQGAETMAQVGRLKLVNPEVERLGKRLDGLIEVTDREEIEADANVKVASGFIETSNVNVASTLVDMIELQRQYDVAVRMMQAADQNANRAASLASLN
jgi:flagellar basal-body rod protein FlgF